MNSLWAHVDRGAGRPQDTGRVGSALAPLHGWQRFQSDWRAAGLGVQGIETTRGPPQGAYFTTLGPGEKNLAKRLRIPKAKLEYVFCFTDGTGLKALEGGRGAFIFYSPDDYQVEEERQIDCGLSEEVAGRLP
jgi:hypothetical protein